MNDSIISEVRKKLKKENKDLYFAHNGYQFTLSNITQIILKSSFWNIFLIMIAIILVIIIYSNKKFDLFFDFLVIDFKELLKVLTSTVITLVSMNLFVTNLLLTHLKEERDDLEKFINKKIPFRFITYFGFSIILLLLFLNLFYGHLECSKNNILIFLAYSFFIFIGALIYLYDKVFKFITKSQRKILIFNELKREFNLNLYRSKFKKVFSENYNEFFANLNFKVVSKNLPLFNDDLAGNINILVKSNHEKYFKDLKYKSLKLLIEKIEPINQFYSTHDLDDKILNQDEILLLSFQTSNEKVNENLLRSKFVYSKENFFDENETNDILETVLEKFDKNIKSGKLEDLTSDLKNFENILNDFYKKY
ncbi:hypothetical protein [Flavobacterium sp. 3-210]